VKRFRQRILSEENIALAQQLASVERQLQEFLDSLPPEVAAEGVLSGLSSEFSLNELAVMTSLWRGGLGDEVELDETLSEQSMEAIRKYRALCLLPLDLTRANFRQDWNCRVHYDPSAFSRTRTLLGYTTCLPPN